MPSASTTDGSALDRRLLTRDVVSRMKSLGATPWFINGGKGRYAFGLWLWKASKWGLHGKIQWHYDASSADSYNPFDGTSPNDFGSYALPDQVCTTMFEVCREGIDDMRYLEYLEQLIAENAKSADPFVRNVVTRARYVINYYNDGVDDRFQSARTFDGSGSYVGDWSAGRMNRMRREVAKIICMFKGTPVPGVYDDVMLVDGEGRGADRQLGGKIVKLVEKNATRGTHSFELAFKGGEGYADQWGRAPERDWRGYRTLKLDVLNAEKRPVTLVLHMRDQFASNMGDYKLQCVKPLVCKPGKNSFTISLVGLKSSNADHVFDLSCLFNYFFTVKDETQDVTLYLDNMRLSPK